MEQTMLHPIIVCEIWQNIFFGISNFKKCNITSQKSAVTMKYLKFGIKMTNFRIVILSYF